MNDGHGDLGLTGFLCLQPVSQNQTAVGCPEPGTIVRLRRGRTLLRCRHRDFVEVHRILKDKLIERLFAQSLSRPACAPSFSNAATDCRDRESRSPTKSSSTRFGGAAEAALFFDLEGEEYLAL